MELALAQTGGGQATAVPLPFWLGFSVFVAVMLALDLGVFNRRHRVIHVREAMLWTGMWVALALLFAVALYLWQHGVAGREQALGVTLAYLTGYIIELSLSVDNLFVIAMIFAYFGVPREHQHSVLFWGIIGALAMRAALIFLGLELIHRFHFTIYIFGAFLVLTGVRMAFSHGRQIELDRNLIVKAVRRAIPVTADYVGGKFFHRADGLFATPLFVALLMVEVTDLIFAVDSIPAILAITDNPFVVVTSNAFAVLGLRSMYFALAGFLARFHLLHYGLSAVLVFIGAKMLLADVYKVPIAISLPVVVLLIGSAIMASLVTRPAHDPAGHGSHADGTAGDVLPEDVARLERRRRARGGRRPV